MLLFVFSSSVVPRFGELECEVLLVRSSKVEVAQLEGVTGGKKGLHIHAYASCWEGVY